MYLSIQMLILLCFFDSLSKNESSIEYDFETIHNIEEYQTEFAPTIRDGMRYWNMTVQFWLANYVYKRAPKSFRYVSIHCEKIC